ncbi:hypothetical protein [Pyrobaculum ferrireducens]|uniref:Uncharacterized protein n=1 Tax=Pyrobaculum ferrireducens TaxID=1104324 RepID=G7VE88_9CREN|nr:hypothetical protein [Pyrobaculum ferrireducens]AET34058.1 hypothetical protein P186_2674 [Pyrobaculum ferrireducens]
MGKTEILRRFIEGKRCLYFLTSVRDNLYMHSGVSRKVEPGGLGEPRSTLLRRWTGRVWSLTNSAT